MLLFASMFLQCDKENHANQVGEWSAEIIVEEYQNDTLVEITTALLELFLNDDKTGIIKGINGEGELEWDLAFSDTKINITKFYFILGENVVPLEDSYSSRYDLLINEKNTQQWYYEYAYTKQDETIETQFKEIWNLTRQ